MKTPTIGQKALAYGKVYTVTGLDAPEGVRRAVLEEVEGLAVREDARRQILALREELRALDFGERDTPQYAAAQARHNELAAEMRVRDDAASQVYARLALRADLLAYWAERDVWVSDGRILSDDQRWLFWHITGRKLTDPLAERVALDRLDATDPDTYQAALDALAAHKRAVAEQAREARIQRATDALRADGVDVRTAEEG
jgi:hypothetical protein